MIGQGQLFCNKTQGRNAGLVNSRNILFFKKKNVETRCVAVSQFILTLCKPTTNICMMLVVIKAIKQTYYIQPTDSRVSNQRIYLI